MYVVTEINIDNTADVSTLRDKLDMYLYIDSNKTSCYMSLT